MNTVRFFGLVILILCCAHNIASGTTHNCDPGFEAHAIADSLEYACIPVPPPAPPAAPLASTQAPFVLTCDDGKAVTRLSIPSDGTAPTIECAKIPTSNNF